MRVFITGGNGGIGRDLVEFFDGAGVEVISPTSGELDLSSSFDLKKYGEFDGFIHCAGVNLVRDYGEVQDEELEKVFRINTFIE